MNIAIVGSEEKYWSKSQKEKAINLIHDILTREKDTVLISGRCPFGGIDIWAEEIADSLGISKLIFPPDVNSWSDDGIKKGYKSRNINIAYECDILYDIEPVGRFSGGYWTYKYARNLGKSVIRKVISDVS